MRRLPPRPGELRRIRLLAMDMDGVLTDAGMYYAVDGTELKKFNTRDGLGIGLLHAAGLRTALVTGEDNAIVHARARKLGIADVKAGSKDKLADLRAIAERHGLSLGEIAFIGDDVNDLEALRGAGFSACPADALPEIRRIVRYVCRAKGGEGAVRELCDLIRQAR